MEGLRFIRFLAIANNEDEDEDYDNSIVPTSQTCLPSTSLQNTPSQTSNVQVPVQSRTRTRRKFCVYSTILKFNYVHFAFYSNI